MAKLIKAVSIQPHRKPIIINIENSLEKFQNHVHGYIESCFSWEDNAWMVGNDEAKLIGMEPNVFVVDNRCNIIDIIAGPILILGADDEGETISLTDRQCEYYSRLLEKHLLIIGGAR